MTTYAHAKAKRPSRLGTLFDAFMLLLPAFTLGACLTWVLFPFGGF